MYDEKRPYSRDIESEVRKFWQDKKLREKASKANKGAKKFYFMDGPPYATGYIHMGTAYNKIVKDVLIRSKRMQGYDVWDKPGYDTHGLPIEYSVEKELGIKGKKGIEEYGIGKFVDKCRGFATKYIGIMNDQFEDLGIWMDWQNPYLTLTNDYIEAIWYTFKKADEKGLLYMGRYPVHVCARCATALAYNEIEYIHIEDHSIYVKFPLKNKKNTFLLVWTTTPWTLPANTGVMVNPSYDYAFVKAGKETLVIAKELVEKVMQEARVEDYKIESTVKGTELEEQSYTNPLEKLLSLPKLEGAYRVVPSRRYVTLEMGTGLVHTAPGHGKEDFEVGIEHRLPLLSPVSKHGEFTSEAGKYSGKKVLDSNEEIIKDLESSGALLAKGKASHDYPICWRCKNKLIQVATQQWFFKVTDIRAKMLEFNKKIKWVPSWAQARFANWLESLSDWPISRQRYWGTPLPIWLCECGEKKVIGSVKELSTLTKIPKDLDLHKPHIDKITIKCEKCGAQMHRVPEVMDVWFDSGVSSWGSLGYPHEKKHFERYWPADVNVEGSDQIRGWWNSQMILSTIAFNKKPFDSIVLHGLVLDVAGNKMSKSQGNVVSPSDVVEKYNRDVLRAYMCEALSGEDTNFSWDKVKEVERFFTVFWNSYVFASRYMSLDDFKPGKGKPKYLPEDKWIKSRLNSVIEQATNAYNAYLFSKAVDIVREFVLEDFSRSYLKFVRRRCWLPGSPPEKLSAYQTIYDCLEALVRIVAPIAPHMTEHVYQNLFYSKASPVSVHLTRLPKPDKKQVDLEIEKEMSLVNEILAAVYNAREQLGLKKRWPIEPIGIESENKTVEKALKDFNHVLLEQANTKGIELGLKPSGAEVEFSLGKVYLNKDRSKELVAEAMARELIRRIQSMRKDMGLGETEKIIVEVVSSKKLLEQLEEKGKEIETEVRAKKLLFSGKKTLEGFEKGWKIEGEKLEVVLSK